MGQVKQALLEREERWLWRLELEDERRWEPELPDPTPEERPPTARQDGVPDPFIFEPRGHYLCDITICLTHRTARC